VRRASRIPAPLIDAAARRRGSGQHQGPEHLGGSDRLGAIRQWAGRADRCGRSGSGRQAGGSRRGHLMSGLADQIVGSAAGPSISVGLSRKLSRYNQRLHLTVAARIISAFRTRGTGGCSIGASTAFIGSVSSARAAGCRASPAGEAARWADETDRDLTRDDGGCGRW